MPVFAVALGIMQYNFSKKFKNSMFFQNEQKQLAKQSYPCLFLQQRELNLNPC